MSINADGRERGLVRVTPRAMQVVFGNAPEKRRILLKGYIEVNNRECLSRVAVYQNVMVGQGGEKLEPFTGISLEITNACIRDSLCNS